MLIEPSREVRNNTIFEELRTIFIFIPFLIYSHKIGVFFSVILFLFLNFEGNFDFIIYCIYIPNLIV